MIHEYRGMGAMASMTRVFGIFLHFDEAKLRRRSSVRDAFSFLLFRSFVPSKRLQSRFMVDSVHVLSHCPAADLQMLLAWNLCPHLTCLY